MENTAANNLTNKYLVNTATNQDLDYWQKEFGISKEELLDAINKGNSPASALEKYVKEMQVA